MNNFPIIIFLLLFSCSLHAQNYTTFKDESGKYGFKNAQQLIVIPAKYDYASDFSENRGMVYLGKKCGAVDSTGNEIIPVTYDGINSRFQEGLAGFKLNDKWGFLNDKGEVIIPFTYSYVKDFSEGIAFVSEGYQQEFFIDKKGNNLFAVHQYKEKKDCKEGLIAARKETKWGCLDKTGKEVIPFEYNDILIQGGEIINVQKDGQWGGMDKSYTLIIPIQYDNAMSFKEGLSAVRQNDKWGFIDIKANIIIPFQYDKWWGGFKDGVATMELDGEKFEIDKTGKRKGYTTTAAKPKPVPVKKPVNTFPLKDTSFITKGIAFGFPKGYKASKYNNANSMTFYKSDSSIFISIFNASGLDIPEIVKDWDAKNRTTHVDDWYKNVGLTAKKNFAHHQPVYVTDYLYPYTFGGGDFIWIKLMTTVKGTGMKELEAVKQSLVLKPMPLVVRDIVPGAFTLGVPAYLEPAKGNLYGNLSIFTDGNNFLYFKKHVNVKEGNNSMEMLEFKEFMIRTGFKVKGNISFISPSRFEITGFYGLQPDHLNKTDDKYEAYVFFADPNNSQDIYRVQFRLQKGRPKNFEADIKELLKTIKIKK